MTLVALVFVTTLATAATNDLTGALQRGLFEEEANRNLDAAAQAYQAVSAQFDKDRKLAATAIFRLGEVYRKQGRTNEAVAQYERIVREFAEEQTLVTLSRQNLVGLRQSPATVGEVSIPGGPDNASAEAIRLSAQLSSIEQLKDDPEKQARAVLALFPDEDLKAMLLQLPRLQQQEERTRSNLTNVWLSVFEVTGKDGGFQGSKIVEYGLEEAQKRTSKQRSLIVQRVDFILSNQKARLQVLEAVAAKTPASPPLTQAARLKQKQLLEEEIKLVEKDLAEIKKQVDVGRATETDVRAKERDVLKLKQQLAALNVDVDEVPVGKASVAVTTDDEEKEIRRIQAMIQNSPDLINAPSADPYLTPLCRAASAGQIRVAGFLLKNGADVNLRQPLAHAAGAGHKAVVELLLRHGAAVNAVDESGRSALHRAAERGFLSVTETLLQAQADVNLRDDTKRTPLTLAVENGSRPVAATLLLHGADPNIISNPPKGGSYNRTTAGAPLHFATVRGDEAMVALLLTNRADVTLRNYQGESPLDIAALFGRTAIVARLIKAGADVNARPTQDSSTPLHRAVESGQREVVQLLLEHGANPNATALSGTAGITPLMLAASRNDPELVALLLKHKADPNLADAGGNTALFRAVLSRSPEVVRALLAAGANPNTRNEGGAPVLLNAMADAQSKEIASALIEAKADVNAATSQGQTALHWAAQFNRKDFVELLINAGADVNLRDKHGMTPLDRAKSAQRQPPPPRAPIPAPAVRPAVVPGSSAKSDAADVAALLRQHGALDELPDYNSIRVTRRSIGLSTPALTQGTNLLNRFTLLEMIAGLPWMATGGVRPALVPFPDFSKVAVTRRDPKTGKLTEIPVDVAAWVSSGDCSNDFLLEWGDSVNIPDREHTLTEEWQGLPTNFGKLVAKCLHRKVTVKVKGELQVLNLEPIILDRVSQQALNSGRSITYFDLPFRLKDFLTGRARLFSTSDLTRVKVRRIDSATGQTHEWLFDVQTIDPANDLWLRDGDVIEVPDKP